MGADKTLDLYLSNLWKLNNLGSAAFRRVITSNSYERHEEADEQYGS